MIYRNYYFYKNTLLSCRTIYEILKVGVSLMIAISKNSRIISILNIPIF